MLLVKNNQPGGNLLDALAGCSNSDNVVALLQVTKSNNNPDDLGGLANHLTNEFGNLANEAKYAAITAENEEVNISASCH